ncbi:MAG: arginine--tRNA ligase [Candidatus Krumholzibacteria bacterium]|nr:arginine--tRNA ligase [Candidatus Krumholzibacteria bacterium]
MLEDLLVKGLLVALEKFGIFEEDVDILLEKPRDRSHGDLSTNLAMVLGKRLGRKPRELAGEIAAGVDFPKAIVESVEIAGPGFINFRLAHSFQVKLLLNLLDPDGALKDIRTGGNKRINVEFISANPTGPLNVVSARAGAFGMTLVRLLDAIGYDSHAEYYVNDAGRQVKMLGLSLRAHYLQLSGETVEFPEDGYHGRYLEIMAQELMEQDTSAIAKAATAFDDESFQRVQAPPGNAEDWRKLPEDESVRNFAKFALMKILSWQRETCRRFGLRFETWYFESELHESKRIERALDRLEKMGALYQEDGATWFRATDFGDEKDRVVVRAEGIPTYFLADIAYHYHKFQRGFERAIDFWGPDHHGYIQRMAGAMEALGVPKDWLEIQILQQVTFLEGGRPIKMSKRAGQFVTMDSLIDEVGADVAKYLFLTRKPNSHLDFDLDLAKAQSNENPVFKVKYAHARICKLIHRAAEEGIEIGDVTDESLGRLPDEVEWNLVGELIRLPQVIVSAANAREPHRLTGYVFDVASLFNQFYQRKDRKILKGDRDITVARLHLCLMTRHVLRVVLDLIGVDAPEVLEVKV